MRLIVMHDFPKHWPDLVDTLRMAFDTAFHNSLVASYAVVKSLYSHVSHVSPPEELDEVVRRLVQPAIHGAFLPAVAAGGGAAAAAAKIPEDGHDLSARLALKLFYRSTASFLTPSAEKLSGTVFEAVISLLQQCFTNEPDFEGDIFEDIDADEQFKRWRS